MAVARQHSSTLLLTRTEVAELLDFDGCIEVVEQAFRLHGEGTAGAPAVMGVHVAGGGFHVKAGVLDLDRSYFAAKANANFPDNRERCGLPTIQGVVLLSDANHGALLAIMDSQEITRVRTAAASAVAARYLARADAGTVTVSGCGVQGTAQLLAIVRVRTITRVFTHDLDRSRAVHLADEMRETLGIPITAVTSLREATRASDIVITCTSASRPIIGPDDIGPGTFIAAVGADNPQKQEIDPVLLARSTIVTDVTDQAATMGDLHHALERGLVTRDAVHAELGQVVAGRKPGRRANDDIIVFDSTGMALQDVAAAVLVYNRARDRGIGTSISTRQLTRCAPGLSYTAKIEST